MTSKSKGLFFFLFFCFVACEEVVELDIDAPQQVVVISEVAPSRPVFVTLTNSQSVLSTSPREAIELADVHLTTPQGERQHLLLETNKDSLDPFIDQLPYFVGTDNLPIDATGDYLIEVQIPGKELITATANIPSAVNVRNVQVENIQLSATNQDEDIYTAEVNFRFFHNLKDRRYHLVMYYQTFELDVVEADTFAFSYLSIPEIEEVFTEIPFTRDFEKGFLIDGSKMEIRNYDIKTRISFQKQPITTNNPPSLLIVELRTTDAAYFDYHYALTRQTQQRDSILTQAVVVPSNINGGLGNFGAYNYSLDFYVFPD